MNKSFSLITLFLFLGISVYFGYIFHTNIYKSYSYENTNEGVVTELLNKNKEPEEYTILLAGDVMLDRGVEDRLLKYGNGDYTFPWQKIRDATKEADVFFFNHEGPMSELGTDTGKIYSFNFDTKAIEGMKYAGTDIVSLANNHALDWGSVALCDTIKNLTNGGIAQVGAGCNKEEADKPFIKNLGDTKIAFIAFTEFYSGNYATETKIGLTRFDEEELKNKIKYLKENELVDIVFVSIHWGEEYKTRSNQTQQTLAKSLVDAGADVIVGHHPHVVQEIENYNNSWIIYSLGNFIFDQKQEGTNEGLMVKITISEKEIKKFESIPISINEYSQPYIK